MSLVFISVYVAVVGSEQKRKNTRGLLKSFAFTFYSNKKRLRESKRACLATHYSLSEQYQLHENLHMLKVIGKCTHVFLWMIAFNVASWAAIVYLVPDQVAVSSSSLTLSFAASSCLQSKFYILREVRVLAGTFTSNAMLYAIITGRISASFFCSPNLQGRGCGATVCGHF